MNASTSAPGRSGTAGQLRQQLPVHLAQLQHVPQVNDRRNDHSVDTVKSKSWQGLNCGHLAPVGGMRFGESAVRLGFRPISATNEGLWRLAIVSDEIASCCFFTAIPSARCWPDRVFGRTRHL
jgi:hypothetical protein